MRIDSHQHFWQLARGDYDWLGPELQAIYQDFLPQQLKPLLADAGIDKTVIVQAAETVAETDFILSLADEHDFVAGVVGWVDLEKAESLATLERLVQHPKFLGIRPIIQGIADPDWMLKPELDPIFRWVIDNNKTFDALVLPVHLENLRTLLTRYPELKVVIDHGAKPEIAQDIMTPWAENMAALAENTSALCKLSGLVTEAGDDASYTHLQPYMQHLLSSFGADRLMWGSDWPVCTLAAGYGEWVAMCEQVLAPLSEAEQAKIWGGNANRFYGLNLGL